MSDQLTQANHNDAVYQARIVGQGMRVQRQRLVGFALSTNNMNKRDEKHDE